MMKYSTLKCRWLLFQFIFIFMFVDYRPSTYGDYEYPGWADAMGWLMAAFSLIFIPIGMIYKINRERDGANLLEVNRVDWGNLFKVNGERDGAKGKQRAGRGSR